MSHRQKFEAAPLATPPRFLHAPALTKGDARAMIEAAMASGAVTVTKLADQACRSTQKMGAGDSTGYSHGEYYMGNKVRVQNQYAMGRGR